MINFKNSLNDLARCCGLEEGRIGDIDALDAIKEATLNDTKGAKPLSHNLLYESYDSRNNIFFNKGSLGFLFELDPLVGSNEGIEKNLTLFFNEELPLGGYLQFLIIASHDITEMMHLWEEGRKYGGERLKFLTEYRKNFINNLSKNFSSASDGRLPRNFRIIVSYSCLDEGRNSLESIIKFKRKFSSKLASESLNPRVCNVRNLIEINQQLLQMQLVTSKKDYSRKYNCFNSLSNQIIQKGYSSTIEDDRIIHETTGLSSKILAPESLPENFSLAEMILLLGNEYKTIPARFVISYSIANNLGATGTSKILTQGDRIISAAGKEYTKHDLVIKEEAREWIKVKALHKKGEVFLTESMQVMITTKSEDIEIAEEVIRGLYNANDWKLSICHKVQRIASLVMLPMMQSNYWNSLDFFKLTRVALSGEVVAKLPLQGEWKGVSRTGALLMGRRGQLFNFNPYCRIGGGGNYNIAMMAPSGAGKSFLLQEIAQSMLASDTAVFIMDIGASYKNLCHLLGGEMVRFNKANKISLNPFAVLAGSGAVYVKAAELLDQDMSIEDVIRITGLTQEKLEALKIGRSNKDNNSKELDGIEVIEIIAKNQTKQKQYFVTKDGIVYAKSMIAAMCNVSGDSRGEAIVERAIIEGVSIYGDQLDITKLTKVLEKLEDSKGDPILDAAGMADSLYPFTEDGIHGRYFTQGEEATFKEMLTVFELEELINDEPLLAVVLQIILMQITMQFLCGDRTRRFMLIVDEAWMILDYAAGFLERFARTVRKYGGSLVVCTQDLSSFENIDGTRKSQAAVLESSTWKLILQQSADGLDSFRKSKAYEKFVGLISSVRKSPENKYSEVLIQTDGASIIGRFAADPYSTALFSTEDKDYAYLMEQEREGVDKHQAILALASKYGDLT